MSGTTRTQRLAEQLDAAGIDAYFASTTTSMGYLHGLFEHGHERLLTLAVKSSGDVCLIAPALSVSQAQRVGIADILGWADSEDPMDAVQTLSQRWNLRSGVIAVDDEFHSSHLLAMQELLPAALFRAGGEVLSRIRSRKEPAEIDALLAAGKIADEVYDEVLPEIRVGMTELELRDRINAKMRARGGTPTFCIVAAGAGSAEPHHLPNERRLENGDLLLLDFGCDLDHYQCDITRCVSIGKATDKMHQVYEIVLRAHDAGRAAVRPGVTGADVDRAARQIIEDAGHGPDFFHRLGHGIGMEGHEAPNLVSTNSLPLEPGNCFSVEPGVYLAGEFGIRIENIVAVTMDGHISMNAEPPRSLPELSA